MKNLSLHTKWKRFALSAALAATVTPLMQAQPAQAQVQLNGAGATFPYPIYSKWFSVYRGARINYQPIGSGGGINAIKNQTVDFGATDAPLSNAELRSMPGAVVHIPTVGGAVAVIYNGLPRGLRLSGPVVANIYLGQITRWNDPQITALNPGMSLPSRRITVARRSDGSGTTYIFTKFLAAVSPQWNRQVGASKAVDWPVGQGGRGNDGVAAIVKSSPGSIGYVEVAYAKQNNLPYASIRNRSGQFVQPTAAGVTAAAAAYARQLQRDVRFTIVNAPGARAYPISGFTYILAYKNQRDKTKGRALTSFLRWAMTNGQGYARSLDYAPLPRSIVTLNTSKINSIR
jgi:phosphate transport system substrate-binding protein